MSPFFDRFRRRDEPSGSAGSGNSNNNRSSNRRRENNTPSAAAANNNNNNNNNRAADANDNSFFRFASEFPDLASFLEGMNPERMFERDMAAAMAASLQENQQQQQQHTASQNNKPTTASRQSLQQLSQIRLCRQDLMVNPSNRECAVCLEENRLDAVALRMPCGHVFHRPCLLEWLQCHSNACPVCRYELPTDNAEFEVGRQQRMQHRKPRFAQHELDQLSIAQLKQLLPSSSSSSSSSSNKHDRHHFTERQELVQYLLSHNCMELAVPPQAVSYKWSDLTQMSISQLKHVMNEQANVFFDANEVVEKNDMLQIFLQSGCLRVLPEKDNKDDNEEEEVDDEVIPPPQEQQDGKPPPAAVAAGPSTSPSVVVETVTEEDYYSASATISSTTANSAFASNLTTDQRTDRTLVMEENMDYDSINHQPAVPTSPTTAATTTTEAAVVDQESDSLMPKKVQGNDDNASDDKKEELCSRNESVSETQSLREEETLSRKDDEITEAGDDDVDGDDDHVSLCDTNATARTETAASSRLSPSIPEEHTSSTSSSGVVSSANSSSSSSSSSSSRRVDIPRRDNVQDEGPSEEVVVVVEQPASETTTDMATADQEAMPPSLSSADDKRSDSATTAATTTTTSTEPSTTQQSRFAHYSIAQLRTLAAQGAIDLSGCLERHEIIDRLVASLGGGGRDSTSNDETTTASTPVGATAAAAATTATNSVESVETTSTDGATTSTTTTTAPHPLETWDVSVIRALAILAQVDLSNCHSRQDMIATIQTIAIQRPQVAQYFRTLSPLAQLSVAQLRAVARERQIGVSDCLEKGDILQRLVRETPHSPSVW